MAAVAREFFLRLLDESLGPQCVRFLEDGRETVVGAREGSGDPAVSLRIHRPRFFDRVVAYGNLGMGEAFMDGDFEMERGELHQLLTILLMRRLDRKVQSDKRLLLKAGLIRLASRLRAKAINVRQHYDAGDDLFECFLDSTMTYSCGYARSVDDDLETLQRNKLDRICRKLRLEPGERLLDIGCGFGSVLIHAAREYGVQGTGVSNSRRHVARGRANVERAGLADRVDIRLQDFSEVEGEFEKIVSVGMMEHVPRREYARYFRVIRRCMAPGGLGLVHAIGCNGPRNKHDPFIQKYIFPASNQPRLSEITLHLERNLLPILDVENIVRHYWPTVLRWLERFRENRGRLDPARYDERWLRMWEYYLHCGIAAAQASTGAVYQVLFGNDHTAGIPFQRI